MPRYQCIQFGQCVKADASEAIEIPPGAESKCPQCGQKLEEVNGGGKFPVSPKIVLIAVSVVLVLGGVIWFFLSGEPNPSGPQAVESALTDVWPWLKISPK
jgi:hypothetical protein